VGVFAGIILWGTHMALTQGLMAKLVADRAPADSEHGGQFTHRLALLVQAQKSLLLGRIQFHRFGGG